MCRKWILFRYLCFTIVLLVVYILKYNTRYKKLTNNLDLRCRSGQYQRIQLEHDSGQAAGGRKVLLARIVGKRKVCLMAV